MSDDISSLAKSVSSETPWWATAPIWLAAGIVGVPSLMAIGAGWFIASSVTKHLTDLKNQNQIEISHLERIENNQEKYWEMVRRTLAMSTEVQLRTCVHQATDQKERDDCMRGISGLGAQSAPFK